MSTATSGAIIDNRVTTSRTGGSRHRAAGAAARSTSSTGLRPTLPIDSHSSDSRPPSELMKISVTDAAMATIPHTGQTRPVVANGMPTPLITPGEYELAFAAQDAAVAA
jgi:hypothetical protein